MRPCRPRGGGVLEGELFNGEYFYQKVMKAGLNLKFKPEGMGGNGAGYRGVLDTLNEQGPKYQYGTGCLSDGVLGLWMARMCGLEEPLVDPAKVDSHLRAVYRYNLRRDLSGFGNPPAPDLCRGQ